MENSFKKLMQGYQCFREKYAMGDDTVMQRLADHGQTPEVMVVACCDSRVSPELLLQCDPGDLFVVRNVANIVPAYEKDTANHGTSAALEYGVCYLHVKHLILLGHSHCGGIQALLKQDTLKDQDDFISRWMSIVDLNGSARAFQGSVDACAKHALENSYQNALTFPFIKTRVDKKELVIHLWFFDIEQGQIFAYSFDHHQYEPLENKNFL